MSDLLNSASLVLIPSGYKEDIVYSEVPTNGNGDLSFTRASDGTRINSAGLVEVTPWNMIPQSSTFNVLPWVYSAGTTLTSGITDFNGTSNAFRYQGTAGAYRYGYNVISAISGQVYTHSIYVRAVSGTQSFKLTDAYTGGGSIISVTTEWQRLTFTTTAVSANIGLEIGSDGTNALDVYICFAQTNIGSTAKPYFPTTDRLNVPRLTYQNGGGGCPSLLLEKQSTNVNTYSEQINSTNYTLNNVTSSENSLTSPDGTINADKIIENTSNSTHSVNRFVSLGGTVDNSAYSVSVFAKAEGRSQVLFYDNAQNVGGITYFNLSTGVVTSGTGKIENFGNGWYRCTIFCLKDNSTSASLQFYLLDSAGNQTYTGNGTSGIGLWGYQVEASSYPTSYIPTTSASATRVADSCVKTGISSLIGQTEGVLFIDLIASSYNADGTSYSLLATLGNSAENFQIYTNNALLRCYISASGTEDVSTGITLVNGNRYKIALAYKSGGSAVFVNGALTNTLAKTTMPTAANLYLNEFATGTYNSSNSFNQAILFTTRLTNTELASLTTL